MKVDIDEKGSYIKAEPGDAPIAYTSPRKLSSIQAENLPIPRTTIVTEDEFFNIHGYIFESSLKIEGTTLQVADNALRIEQEIEDQSRRIETENIENVCPKKISVKMTRLSMVSMHRMLTKTLCPKNAVLKVKKLSADAIKKYSRESTPETHMMGEGDQKSYQCTVCSKEFRWRNSLKYHQDVEHKTVRPIQRAKYRCQICSKIFLHSGALKQHLQVHMGEKASNVLKNWNCQFCKMKFFTSQELNVHRGTHQELSFYQCKLCPMNFTNKGAVQSHEREHNRKPNMERLFECYLCKQKFALLHFLRNHMRIHAKKHDCRICLQMFNSETDLDTHMLTHSGKYRFECSQCSKGFDYRTSFVRHARIHSGEKPFQCEHCHKTFREKDYLIAHKRNHSVDKTIDRTKFTWKYSDDRKFRQSKTNKSDRKRSRVRKTFKCKICFKFLKNENELNRHFETHTGKHLFECQECDYQTDYRPNLYRHIKTHLGLKPFQCDLCPNRYGDSGSLKAHMRCHNGEKVECDICQRQFTEKGYLKIHKRIHTGEKPFQCLQCNTKYMNKQSLKMHKCYKCEICSSYLPSKFIITRHILDHLKSGQTNFH